MEVNITKNELYTMIKDAVRDVLHEERMDFILKSFSEVSQEEMKDIENLYGSPPKTKDVGSSETIEI